MITTLGSEDKIKNMCEVPNALPSTCKVFINVGCYSFFPSPYSSYMVDLDPWFSNFNVNQSRVKGL